MSGFSLSSLFLPCFFSKVSLLGGRLVFGAFWEDNFLNLPRKLPWSNSMLCPVEFMLPFRHYLERRVNDLGPSCLSHLTFCLRATFCYSQFQFLQVIFIPSGTPFTSACAVYSHLQAPYYLVSSMQPSPLGIHSSIGK